MTAGLLRVRESSTDGMGETESMSRVLRQEGTMKEKRGSSPELLKALRPFAAWEDGKLLRAGYTTGSCAAAAARAAVEMLVTGRRVELVSVKTPAGAELRLAVEEIQLPTAQRRAASCAVQKDAGDDPDVTDGILIYAEAEALELAEGEGESELLLFGGRGVGTVTRPGLDQPIGEAAINRVPREMIAHGVREALSSHGMHGRIAVTISAPGGERLAEKTFNPRLGIQGGISILGTEGIVRPMSRSALVDTIRTDVRMHAECGGTVLAVPGNYGLHFLAEHYGVAEADPVIMSNFVGETIDAACEFGVRRLLLAGHIGKFVKLAGGIMNTHSREADCRAELIAAHALRCGCDAALARAVLDTAVTQEAVSLLKEVGLLREVSASLLRAMEMAVARRAGGRTETALLFYTLEDGVLAESKSAAEMIEESVRRCVRY